MTATGIVEVCRKPQSMSCIPSIEKGHKAVTLSYAIIDSQGIKIIFPCDAEGFVGGNKTKGGKRHAVVDTLGNPVQAMVHAANIHATRGG